MSDFKKNSDHLLLSPCFPTLGDGTVTYQASNNEIPSVFKPGFSQPISGPLPITQHLEENVTWLPRGHTPERDVSNKRDD